MTHGTPHPPGAPARLSVMYVEDDDDVAFVVAAGLRLAGLEVSTYHDPMAALAALASGARPDAIVSDLRMPALDGIAFVRRAREATGRIVPAIIMSGFATAAEEQEAAELGVRIVHKPIAPSALHEQVRSITAAN